MAGSIRLICPVCWRDHKQFHAASQCVHHTYIDLWDRLETGKQVTNREGHLFSMIDAYLGVVWRSEQGLRA